MKFLYKIISTIDTKDHTDNIKVGDILYADETESFETKFEASEDADKLLSGLDGGRAFNLALASSETVFVEEGDE